MKTFESACVDCNLNKTSVSDTLCDYQKMLHPRSQQAFDNIKEHGGLHMICRQSSFRQFPYQSK